MSRTAVASLAALALLTLTACGQESSQQGQTVTVTRTPPTATVAAAATSSQAPSSPALRNGARIPPAMNPSATSVTPSTTPVPTGTPRGLASPTAPDLASAESVASAFCQVIYVRDGSTDTRPADAVRRASKWMTPRLAQQIATTPIVREDAVTNPELTAKQGYTTVTVEPDPEQRAGVPGAGDHGNTATWGRVATITYKSDNGWSAPLETRRCAVLLTRTGTASPWAVDQILIQ